MIKISLLLSLLVFSAFFSGINAQSKNILHIKGLQETVEVLRDEWGVNHIYAKNQHDLFFAQGFCAAKDRLFQFEIWRRQATGTVAEILGPGEIKRDIGTRLFKYRGDMKKELQHYHRNGIQIVQSYINGVNAYIDEMLADTRKLPIEFKLLKILPGRWTPEVVISRHQGLLGNAQEELNYGRAVAKIGTAEVKKLEWFHPKDPDITLDTAIIAASLFKNILGPYNDSHRDIVFDKASVKKEIDEDAVMNSTEDRPGLFDGPDDHNIEGSNNWIISGRRSSSGYPMLANDPHRKVAVPSLRYIVHLVAPGWNVTGGGEPEIPGVSIGHNEAGAWGLTIFETDGEDIYVYDLDPDNLTNYKYKGNWMPMKEIQETINVRGAKPVTVNLYYTVHGPVTFIDTPNHKAYAVKCAWLEPGGAPYLASLRIDQATDWESFREACSYSHIPAENMVWADRKGNIGWQAVGIVPIRKNFSGLVPVPGDGRYEWAGYLPIKERPHSLNPAKGFFATANQNVTPANYGHWDAIGYTWADAFRGERINEVLSANNTVTMRQMASLQTDYYSIPARSLVPFLRSLNFEDSLTNMAKYLLLKWNYVLDKNSIEAGIYVIWERQIMKNIQLALVPESVRSLISVQLSRMISMLQNPETYFENNAVGKRDLLLKESFEQAIVNLKKKLGNNPSDWKYGQANYKHVELMHQLSSIAGDSLRALLDIGPLPRGGDSFSPCSTGGTDNQMSGASFRILVDTKDWDKTLMINTPGESGNPSSPFYKNLFAKWANDQYFPSYYSEKKVLESTTEMLELKPVN
jgi:penicillin amidase